MVGKIFNSGMSHTRDKSKKFFDSTKILSEKVLFWAFWAGTASKERDY